MKKRNVIILMISLSLVLLLGSSYAYLRNVQVGNTPYVINVGTLQVTFEEGTTNKLELTNMYPMTDEEGSEQEEFTFTVKNTGTVGAYYDVYIEETSTDLEFKTVIRFMYSKNNSNYSVPKTLSDNKYIDVGGYLKSQESATYKLKVWLAEETGSEYMDQVFTARIVVKGMQESNYAKDVLKKVLVPYEKSSIENFEGGLVAVNTNGNLYNETEEGQVIREYRYSGLNVNNYVYFNCNPDVAQSESTCEKWRIVGIFKEGEEEHLKLVKDNILTTTDFPAEYTKDGTTYKIRGSSNNTAYWNNGGKNDNDWSTAGLQYWLNGEDKTGYLSKLNTGAKDMIANTKYYLGSVTSYTLNQDTPTTAYQHERAVEGCTGGVGPDTNTSSTAVENNKTCRVWKGNLATWTGKIGLLYPSDYGFSADETYWNIGLYNFEQQAAATSWLQSANHSDWEWLLSHSSYDSDYASSWDTTGNVDGNIVDYSAGVRPTLYLKSNVEISGGTGEATNPYTLILN